MFVLGTGEDPTKAKKYARKKHIDFCTFEDIVAMHKSELGINAVSRPTLKRCWETRWSSVIVIKNIGQGKKCRKCAIIEERRRKAVDQEDKARLSEELRLHHDENKADRNYTVRCNHVAEQDAKKWNLEDGLDLFGKISLDGMDEAKWQCPLLKESNADFDACWKTHLHVVCAIVHGVVECFFLMPPDLPKDSNMEATIITRAIDVASELMPSGTCLPHSWSNAADNTAREAKNQHQAQYSAWQVGTDKFEGLENGFLKTGHSHNEVDQRFSSANTCLKSAPTLEDPYDAKEWLEAHMKPVRGRALHVEVLESIMDFRKWLAPLNILMGGLSATHGALDTCHSWRFVQRKVLGHILGYDEDHVIENSHKDWQSLEPHDHDVILLLKESLSSTQLAQKPLLVLPHEVAATLDPDNLKPVVRSQLGPVTIREFRKTANVVASEPWYKFRAERWLTELCDANDSNKPLPNLVLPFLRYHKRKNTVIATTFGVQSSIVPRTVTLKHAGPALTAKRLLGHALKAPHVKAAVAAAVTADSSAGPADEYIGRAHV